MPLKQQWIARSCAARSSFITDTYLLGLSCAGGLSIFVGDLCDRFGSSVSCLIRRWKNWELIIVAGVAVHTLVAGRDNNRENAVCIYQNYIVYYLILPPFCKIVIFGPKTSKIWKSYFLCKIKSIFRLHQIFHVHVFLTKTSSLDTIIPHFRFGSC